jgi:hypothetical protein
LIFLKKITYIYNQLKIKKMKIEFKTNGINLELTYSDCGSLEYVRNLDTNEHLMIELKHGYDVKESRTFLFFEKTKICKAYYAFIPSLNIFVPSRMFISAVK